MRDQATAAVLSPAARFAVLATAFIGLIFDGFELGLMPVASLAVSQSLLGPAYTPTLGGEWFAKFTAAMMLGAAIGGIALGDLGDRIGRARAMGISIIFYSCFAGLGAFVTTQEQMLVLRFLVGLGIGGMWPNGVALASECWPNASRPMIAGILGAGINIGILILASIAGQWPITAAAWRWIFYLAAIPAIVGIVSFVALPESPRWLATRFVAATPARPLRELFQIDLVRTTLAAIMLSSIPLVGAWAGSKWMLPWAKSVSSDTAPGYEATTQWWWAIGATFGSFTGAPLSNALGRRTAYVLYSLGATVLTWSMFQLTAPGEPWFLKIVCAQGFVATLFFGWLPLYLPESFPTRVRATGSGLAYNTGRFATAGGVLAAGYLFTHLGGDFAAVGAACSFVYALGLVAIWLAPDTTGKGLED
jgi:MFS family permease